MPPMISAACMIADGADPRIAAPKLMDVLAKSKGSSNPHNLVKATIAALCELRDAYSVAQVRGISMSKVFNG